jgi:hypothetical protein
MHNYNFTVYRLFRVIAKNITFVKSVSVCLSVCLSVCPSVRLYETILLPLDGF